FDPDRHMSSATPLELSASGIIERIEAGDYPREVLMTIARGFLPLSQEELVAVLSYLAASGDAEAAGAARESLAEVPPTAPLDIASNEQANPEHLALMVLGIDEPQVLE